MNGFWMRASRGLTLVDNASAIDMHSDGGVAIVGQHVCRLTLFCRRFADENTEIDPRVVARLTLPAVGWRWTMANARHRATAHTNPVPVNLNLH